MRHKAEGQNNYALREQSERESLIFSEPLETNDKHDKTEIALHFICCLSC